MNRIKELRNKKGLSQKQLAEIMEVRQSAIANWESDYRKPNVWKAIQLAKILDTTVEDLYK